jgi:hypothetical protein
MLLVSGFIMSTESQAVMKPFQPPSDAGVLRSRRDTMA